MRLHTQKRKSAGSLQLQAKPQENARQENALKLNEMDWKVFFSKTSTVFAISSKIK